MCSVLQPSGESRVEVLDFNAHISRAPTTAEKLAATRLGIDPEQPPDGARLVCEPSVFPVDLVFANEVVTSLPYYAVPAPGQHEPYIGYMMDEQRLLGVKVRYRASCIARDNVLMSDLNLLLILGWVIRLLRLLMETWERSMFTRFEWTRCMSRSQQCCNFTLRGGRRCIFPWNARQARSRADPLGFLPRCPFPLIEDILFVLCKVNLRATHETKRSRAYVASHQTFSWLCSQFPLESPFCFLFICFIPLLIFPLIPTFVLVVSPCIPVYNLSFSL